MTCGVGGYRTGMAPRSRPRHEPERVYERAADPAEAADRPLEPKSSPPEHGRHPLNTPVGEPDPTSDSDPYQEDGEDQDSDRASGTRGAHQGAEDR